MPAWAGRTTTTRCTGAGAARGSGRAGRAGAGLPGQRAKHSTFIDTALDLMDDDRMPPRCGGSGRMRGTASTARRWKRCWIRRRCNGLNCIRAGAAAGGDARRSRRAALLRGLRLARWTATAHEWLDRLDGETDETLQRSRAVVAACAPARRDAGGVAPGLRQTAGHGPGGLDGPAGLRAGRGRTAAMHDSRPLHISASAAQRRHMDASQPAWRREIRALHPTWKRFDGPGRTPRRRSWRAWAAHCRVLAACATARCTACCRSISRRAPASPATARSASASACPAWAGRSRRCSIGMTPRACRKPIPRSARTWRSSRSFPPNRWRRPRSRCSRRPRAGPGRIGATRTASRT